jgi:MFS family permease
LIKPDITASHYAWFGASLLIAAAFAMQWSPRRRRIIGSFRYLAAWGLIAGLALFGAICVRGGYALALQEQGMNGVLAQILGLLAGLMFILLARIGFILFPPAAGLLKEWRRANREASLLRRMFRPRVD